MLEVYHHLRVPLRLVRCRGVPIEAFHRGVAGSSRAVSSTFDQSTSVRAPTSPTRNKLQRNPTEHLASHSVASRPETSSRPVAVEHEELAALLDFISLTASTTRCNVLNPA